MSQSTAEPSSGVTNNEQHGAWDEKALSRRRFMNITFWAATGISVAAIGLPATQYLAGRAAAEDGGNWVEVGVLTAFDPEIVNRVTYTVRAKDAWRDVERVGVLYAYSEDAGQSYVVLDGTCSHLGCIVHWKSEENHFACPCHAGHFTRQGEVMAGPPPRALSQVPAKIEDGVLWVQV